MESVKIIRRELGLTQLELAIKLGVNPSTIYRWETHRTIPPLSAMILLESMAKDCKRDNDS